MDIFRSNQSKIIVFFASLSIIVSLLKGFDSQKIIGQIIIYFLVARNADCLIYGKCYNSSWISILVPLLGIVIFLLDYFGYFKRVKLLATNLKNKIGEINDLNIKNIDNNYGEAKRIQEYSN